MSKKILLVGFLVAVFGFVLGRQIVQDKTIHDRSETAAKMRSANSFRRAGSGFRLQPDMNEATLAAVVAQIPEDEFAKYADLVFDDFGLGHARHKFLLALLGEWTKTEPEAAFEWAQGNPIQDERFRFLDRVMKVWAADDPKSAMGMAGDYHTQDVRDELLGIGLVVWAKKEPSDALAWVKELPGGPLRDSAERSLIYLTASTAPDQSAKFLLSKGPLTRGAQGEVSEIMSHWANMDPLAAKEWAMAIDDEYCRNIALLELAQTWGYIDPAQTHEMYDLITEENQKSAFAASVAEGWAETDPDAAFEWATNLEEEESRELATLSALYGQATFEPTLAAEKAMSIIQSEAESEDDLIYQGDVAAIVVSQWAGQDPQAAADWLRALPNERHREKAITQLVQEWPRLDIEGFQSWREEETDPAFADAVTIQAADKLMTASPDKAMEWLGNLNDQQLAQTEAKNFFERWHQDEPEDAEAWLKKQEDLLNKTELSPHVSAP